MDKLISIRIDDLGGQLRVTGYAAREKNRARLWTFHVDREFKADIPKFVDNAEKARLGLVEA